MTQNNLSEEVFKKGMIILTNCFSALDITDAQGKLYFRLLGDLTDRLFKRAVDVVCMENPQVYKDTNILALIKDAAKRNYKWE